MTNLTALIDELEKLSENATPGPWEPCIGSGNCEMTALSHQEQEGPGTEFVCDLLPDWALGQSPRKVENMDFIIAVRNAIPQLCQAVRELSKALGYYGDALQIRCRMKEHDDGVKAREMLAKFAIEVKP